jgi:predicted HicB family RNase H-like nuclease
MTAPGLKRLVVHVTPDRHKTIKVIAAQAGISMSEYINRLVDAELRRLR